MSQSIEPRASQAPQLAKLGDFLRSRRMLLTPDRAGFASSRRRRAPGLRREEVAAVAGISADWYARIELGGGAVPSVQTLQAIARALQLDGTDTQYLFELAGLPIPRVERSPHRESLAAIEHAILTARETGCVAYDLYGSPLCWNELADGLFRWSSYSDAFSRNTIVAGLTNPYYREFFGRDFETVSRGVVGVFRRAYTTSEPPALARRVFEFASGYALFQQLWNEHSVSEDHGMPSGPFVRHVPELGTLALDGNDLMLVRRHDLIFRVVAPADDETRAKFPLLAKLGKASPFIDVGD